MKENSKKLKRDPWDTLEKILDASLVISAAGFIGACVCYSEARESKKQPENTHTNIVSTASYILPATNYFKASETNLYTR